MELKTFQLLLLACCYRWCARQTLTQRHLLCFGFLTSESLTLAAAAADVLPPSCTLAFTCAMRIPPRIAFPAVLASANEHISQDSLAMRQPYVQIMTI